MTAGLPAQPSPLLKQFTVKWRCIEEGAAQVVFLDGGGLSCSRALPRGKRRPRRAMTRTILPHARRIGAIADQPGLHRELDAVNAAFFHPVDGGVGKSGGVPPTSPRRSATIASPTRSSTASGVSGSKTPADFQGPPECLLRSIQVSQVGQRVPHPRQRIAFAPQVADSALYGNACRQRFNARVGSPSRWATSARVLRLAASPPDRRSWPRAPGHVRAGVASSRNPPARNSCWRDCPAHRPRHAASRSHDRAPTLRRVVRAHVVIALDD